MTVLALLLAVTQATSTPPAGTTGKPKASMVVEPDDGAAQPPTPLPQGDERKAIGDYIRDNSSDVRDCYASRLRERPTLSGKVVARFDIGPTGKVIGAMADGIADRELIKCIVTAVRKWEFEKPASGGKLRVAYPYKFEPQPAR
jgi:outer membrane biosynthesis protein TonB